MTRTLPGAVARVLDVVILISGLVITGVGGILLAGTDSETPYIASTACAQQADALSQPCYTKALAQLTDVRTIKRTRTAAEHPQITFFFVPEVPATGTLADAYPGRVTVFVPQPTPGFYDMHAGDTIVAKVWHGIVTAVYTLHDAGARGEGNPIAADDEHRWAGYLLLGIGVILLIARPVGWLVPAPMRRLRTWSWSRPSVGVGSMLGDVQLRVALVGLLSLNLLDIATSVLGNRVGLYEQNPVAALMWARFGPLAGFITVKLPAFVAIILAMGRVPRRIALLLAWVGCLVMLWVVLDNIRLINTVSPPRRT